MRAYRHVYNYLIYDSNGEREFAEKLDGTKDIAVYVKLPRGFYINTPVGKYNPDWAIAFEEGKTTHIYFVAETRGDLSTMELRKVKQLKVKCAKEQFRAISSDLVRYGVVDNYSTLLSKVTS